MHCSSCSPCGKCACAEGVCDKKPKGDGVCKHCKLCRDCNTKHCSHCSPCKDSVRLHKVSRDNKEDKAPAKRQKGVTSAEDAVNPPENLCRQQEENVEGNSPRESLDTPLEVLALVTTPTWCGPSSSLVRRVHTTSLPPVETIVPRSSRAHVNSDTLEVRNMPYPESEWEPAHKSFSNEGNAMPPLPGGNDGRLFDDGEQRVLQVMNWNCRSYRKAIESKTPWSGKKYDLVFLQETAGSYERITTHRLFQESVKDFKYSLWISCTTPKRNNGYGGVGVLFQKLPKSVAFEVLPEKSQFHGEGRIVLLRYAEATFCCAYMPCYKTDEHPSRIRWDRELAMVLQQEKVLQANMCLCTDANVVLSKKDISKPPPGIVVCTPGTQFG